MKKIRIIVLSVLLLLCAAASVYFCSRQEYKMVERTFFFPEPVSKTLKTEYRLLPVQDTLEKNLELMVKEVFLGPSLLTLDRVFPDGARLNHIFLRDGILYIDMNSRAAMSDSMFWLTFPESLDILEKTLRKNYNGIDRIVFTVNGSIPE